MKFNYKLKEGFFIKRPNRFLTLVKLGNKVVESHLPDPGRLKELLIPGTKVLLKDENGEHRKTKYSTQAVFYKEKIISLNTLLPNQYVEYLINNKKLDFLYNWKIYKREVNCDKHRFDFQLEKNGKLMYLEVKSVTLVENNIAKFPDSVTTRGANHVKYLGDLAAKGFMSMVIFVIQRHDSIVFQPNWERDYKFSQALLQASNKGLSIRAIHSKLTKDRIHFSGEIPIEMSSK